MRGGCIITSTTSCRSLIRELSVVAVAQTWDMSCIKADQSSSVYYRQLPLSTNARRVLCNIFTDLPRPILSFTHQDPVSYIKRAILGQDTYLPKFCRSVTRALKQPKTARINSKEGSPKCKSDQSEQVIVIIVGSI